MTLMYHPTGASNTTTNESNVPQKHGMAKLAEAEAKVVRRGDLLGSCLAILRYYNLEKSLVAMIEEALP